MIRVVNASRTMTREELEPYVDDILAHFEKLARRFPADLTVQSLAAEADHGKKELWLVFDGDRLLATAFTRIETIDATGVRILRMMDLAGENIEAWADELEKTMEAYGNEHGVDYRAVEGREGWGRVIEKWGYRKHAVLWRKRVA